MATRSHDSGPRELAPAPARSLLNRQASSNPPRRANNLLDVIASGLLFVDEGGVVRYANESAREMLGGSLLGRRVEDLIPGLVLHGDGRQDQMEHVDRDGRAFVLGYRCDACQLEEVLGTVVSFRNITELEQLRESIHRMKRLSEVGEMCAVVAHEIRNPLAGLKTTIQSIEREAAQAGLDGPLDLMQREVDRLSRLLDGFLSFVRARPVQRRLVDIALLLERARCGAGSALEGRSCEVDCPNLTGFVDREQMLQVLINLIVNAGQASPRGGRVWVSCRRDEEWLKISVRDEGRGIAPEIQHRVFDPFFTTKERGTGLGLSVCYQIVNAHGGTITVEESSERGTTMAVRIPIQPVSDTSQ